MPEVKVRIPLSPPDSPRMSGANVTRSEHFWPTQTLPVDSQSPISETLLFDEVRTHAQSLNARQIQMRPSRPSLRTHRSFPYTSGLTQNPVAQDEKTVTNALLFEDVHDQSVTLGQPLPTLGLPGLPQATYGGSAPTSPQARLTSTSPKEPLPGADHDYEDTELDPAEQDDGEIRPPMTAAELRAHKRKMKRFRLTHNQTRFLMSEFARQPHPDAAHRERLSREIPGLSPRQVQVWFQNRRAKLKRLNTDDRERMLRSRALPVNFDMTQALHSPFTSQQSPNAAFVGLPMLPPILRPAFGNAVGTGPLAVDTSGHISACNAYDQHGPQYSSSFSTTPALAALAFTPPQSATDLISPGTTLSNAAIFNMTMQSSTRSPTYGTLHSQASWQSIPEEMGHSQSATAGPQLRSSTSYPEIGLGEMSQGPSLGRAASVPNRFATLHEGHEMQRNFADTVVTPEPIGLGFSYMHTPHWPNVDRQQPHQYHRPQPNALPREATQPSDSPQSRRKSSLLVKPTLTPTLYEHFEPSQLAIPDSHYQESSSFTAHGTPRPAGIFRPPDSRTPAGPRASFAPTPTHPYHFLGFSDADDRNDSLRR
ncbi:hypothetical protein BAUCODRAFT_27052 [Baudoinia panamericana UAMH 10762]|uniref:Homeobox domain-containing protein n=1 Tax=Baudoinia panamericana (strain UAMH 10762) TaxID=717646 RepID=M2MMQ2_BAUPA|nr:uncharacterized protein BAUCODRAFT_27052 [Baudoinia panamericana UAMH 10762]EMC92698.1 hypothetical protein BAUCODRAFT_27052 [Baudoinia panamericana UAMH 10762]